MEEEKLSTQVVQYEMSSSGCDEKGKRLVESILALLRRKKPHSLLIHRCF